MARDNPTGGPVPVARRPNDRRSLIEIVTAALSSAFPGLIPAGRRSLIEISLAALFIAVAGSMASLPPRDQGEMDSASTAYLILCFITFILGLLRLSVFIAGVRLPAVLANFLASATLAATVAVSLLSPPPFGRRLMASPKAKQQEQWIIPISAGCVPSSSAKDRE